MIIETVEEETKIPILLQTVVMIALQHQVVAATATAVTIVGKTLVGNPMVVADHNVVATIEEEGIAHAVVMTETVDIIEIAHTVVVVHLKMAPWQEALQLTVTHARRHQKKNYSKIITTLASTLTSTRTFQSKHLARMFPLQ
jgi:hypothetical protein